MAVRKLGYEHEKTLLSRKIWSQYKIFGVERPGRNYVAGSLAGFPRAKYT